MSNRHIDAYGRPEGLVYGNPREWWIVVKVGVVGVGEAPVSVFRFRPSTCVRASLLSFKLSPCLFIHNR